MVYSQNRCEQPLGPEVASGGEATIYCLERVEKALVKIYHPQILEDTQRARTLRKKLEAMVAARENFLGDEFAWPQFLVYDASGRWIGYAMRRQPGKILQELCGAPIMAKINFPHWTRCELVKVAHEIIRKARFLEKLGVIMGDVSPANILLDPATGRVILIDCDSYQFKTSQDVLPCQVRTQLYSAPELLDARPGSYIITAEQNVFSLAVLVFQVLMLGLHPYSHVGAGDPVDCMRRGECPWGPRASYRAPAGPWWAMWSHLPYALKGLFIRAFRDGHSAPEKRPFLLEWQTALRRYLHLLEQGTHCRDLVPARP